ADGRCDARAARGADASAPLPFRCCHGAPFDAPYPVEPHHPVIAPLTIDAEVARDALAAVPELMQYAETFALFTDAEAAAPLTRGRVGLEVLEGFERAPSAFAFSPARGELAWVLAGRAGDDTVIAVLYPLPDGQIGRASCRESV